MRSLVLAALLLAAPAFAKAEKAAPKAPRVGQFCKKDAVGTTAKDAKGNELECKKAKNGVRWTKK